MKFFLAVFSFSFLFISGGVAKTSDLLDSMESFVMDPDESESKEKIAVDDLFSLNSEMFTIYNKTLEIDKKNFLDRHNLIMGLFSGKGGRFILYRPGKPPLEAESPSWVYSIAKSVGHCAMATFDLLAPYVLDPSADLAWLGSLKSYRTRVQTALDALNVVDIKKDERDLFRNTLKQIATFMDTCIKNQTYTIEEVQWFTYHIKPNLAKLIDVATSIQVGHWWKVLEEWKQMLGDDWETTYALSNSIYVARQNNILFSILVQFFGEKAINDRLLLLETTDFTTTPEMMMGAFMRIVSDRVIGEAFFGNDRLMDFELLGGSGRRVIEAEAAKRGGKAILPPLVPFNSTEWPWKIDPNSGTGPATMEEIQATPPKKLSP